MSPARTRSSSAPPGPSPVSPPVAAGAAAVSGWTAPGLAASRRTRARPAAVYAPPVSTAAPDPRPGDPRSPDDPLVALFEGGRRLHLGPGAVLFNEGDASNRVILVIAGRVKASSTTEEGLETVLGFRGAGEVLGELSALDGEGHVATVTVVEAVEALAVPAAQFVAALEGDPAVARSLLRRMAVRQREADRRRAEFVALDVTGRVAQRLVELAEEAGEADPDGIRIGMPISQRELAGWVGASREAVNKSLALLADQGLVIAARRRLVVRDLDALRCRAG